MSDAAAAASASPKTAAMIAPIDLAALKQDLLIPPGDTTYDAWLQRRCDALWAHFQQYTSRPLLLESGWVDDWGRLSVSSPALVQPSWPYPPAPRGSVYLTVYPVKQLTKLTLNGVVVTDLSGVLFEKSSGKLFSLSGPPAADLGSLLLSMRARIEYTAGFATLPADIYEALKGAVEVQFRSWAAMQSGGIAVGGFVPTRISTIDVGQVDLSLAPTSFEIKGLTDPLLGPYTNTLDPYIDYRTMLGGPLPTSEALP